MIIVKEKKLRIWLCQLNAIDLKIKAWDRGGVCDIFITCKEINHVYKWNFMTYCQIFGFMVIFNNKFSIQEKAMFLGWPILNFIAIPFNWRFPVYHLSDLLKRNITNDNWERKKLRIRLCQLNAIRYGFLIKLKFLASYSWW